VNFILFMQEGGWALFSLIAAVFSAGFFLVNQYLRQPGHLLVFWMRLLVVLCLSPLAAGLELPANPRFYLAVLVTVFVGTFSDIRTFNACTVYGGGVVSRVQPLTVWGTFLLWLAVDPGMISAYAARPFNTAGILAALAGCVYFAMRLEKCKITRAAFLYVLPALCGYTLTNVLNKYAMGLGSLDGAVYGYMYVQSALAVLLIGAYSLWAEAKGARIPPVKPWATKEMLAATLIAGFSWICHMIYKNYAMAFTPNPSYQVAINLTTPVFIEGFYYLAKHREEADVKSGMGIVACAALLAVMTVT
jgi:hypothetical protein